MLMGIPSTALKNPRRKGVTAILYYDAAGRTVRTEMPDGTFARVEFSPWFVRSYDANDTVLESRWFTEMGGNPNWNETADAPVDAKKARGFLAQNTRQYPAETHLDSLGREVVALAHNRFRKKEDNAVLVVEEKYRTYTKLDAESKPLWLEDARGNRVMEYITQPGATTGYVPCYDIAGNLLFQHSNEAGDRWMLPDVTGQPMYAWDFNDRFPGEGTVTDNMPYASTTPLRRPTRNNGCPVSA
ncbi:MAG: hypothetical protein IPL65_19370 [Lewinellaceae bacterium]|nr:hypothetical protein [Lewinellaceae bacterium]